MAVLETLTPLIDKHMATLMDDAGFAVDAHVHHLDETIDEWSRLVRPFKRYEAGRPRECRVYDALPPNYILFASKMAPAMAA